MSANTDEPADDSNVLPFARPPIRQSTVVNGACERAFDVFVRRIAEWWPLVPFSRGHHRVRSVDIEERVGGQIVERWDDGTTWVWGDVLTWDEPSSFVMTWNVTGTPTVVELRFARIADTLTRVELEHRGWEHLSEAELGDECAVPGGYFGGAFHTGWQEILSRFKDAMETTTFEQTTNDSLEEQ